MHFRKEWAMEKGNWELWGVYSRGVFEFEIGAGNPYVWEERKEKTLHTHRASRVRAEIAMAKAAGKPTWALSDPDVQAVLRMPMKGSRARACCAGLSVFLTTEKHVKSVARSFPLCAQWIREALPGSSPHQLHTGWAASRQDLDVDKTGSPSPRPCLSAPDKQGLPTCLCCPLPQTNLGIQELESLGLALNSTLHKWLKLSEPQFYHL